MLDITPVILAVILGGLTALLPGWRLSQRLYFISRFPILSACMVLMGTAALTALALWVPFLMSKGKDVGPHDMLIDLLLFGAFPLGLIALVAYAIDHFAESPTMVLVAGAACFAIAMLPLAYLFFGPQLLTDFNITVSAAP